MSNQDTIYALASASGKGGVAVVRVSGPLADKSVENITGKPVGPARVVNLRKFLDPVSRETIDFGVVVFFKNPASFTGEDVAEFHVHGGVAIVKSLYEALSKIKGLRPAQPGEFTRRAFENGKIDLTTAEAIADLVDAQTQAQKNQALSQFGGSLADLYNGWCENLKGALAHLEAEIDFSDEELPDGVSEKVRPVLENLHTGILYHLGDNRRGELLREGVRVAVIGAPNAGKSSLVNRIAQRDVAIVSEHAGTTRDIIEVQLDLGGVPVIVSDTAGLRPDQIGNEGQDAIEGEGIRRALKLAEDADLKVIVFDGGAEAPDRHSAALIDERSFVVVNKSDLGKGLGLEEMAPFRLSALSGDGLDGFFAALGERVSELIGSSEAPALTRQRHRDALTECADSLARALAGEQPELVAEDVRLAIRALGRITGRVDVEDLLDVIFRDFCIGK